MQNLNGYKSQNQVWLCQCIISFNIWKITLKDWNLWNKNFKAIIIKKKLTFFKFVNVLPSWKYINNKKKCKRPRDYIKHKIKIVKAEDKIMMKKY